MEKLIEIIDLKTYFRTEAGIAKAVDGVSFDIFKENNYRNFLNIFFLL